jgi:hypothetical protein
MRRGLRTILAFGILLPVVLVVNVAPVGATSSHNSDSKYEHIFYTELPTPAFPTTSLQFLAISSTFGMIVKRELV